MAFAFSRLGLAPRRYRYLENESEVRSSFRPNILPIPIVISIFATIWTYMNHFTRTKTAESLSRRHPCWWKCCLVPASIKVQKRLSDDLFFAPTGASRRHDYDGLTVDLRKKWHSIGS